MSNRRGQSIVEVLFLIAFLGLILTGAVAVLVNTINVRTKSLDRKKAVEISDMVMENLLNQKETDPATFWKLSAQTNQQAVGYSGYQYTVGYTNTPSCPVTKCTEAVISIKLVQSSGVGDSLTFTRSFSK